MASTEPKLFHEILRNLTFLSLVVTGQGRPSWLNTLNGPLFWFGMDMMLFSSCSDKLNDVFSIDTLSFGYIVVLLWMY